MVVIWRHARADRSKGRLSRHGRKQCGKHLGLHKQLRLPPGRACTFQGFYYNLKFQQFSTGSSIFTAQFTSAGDLHNPDLTLVILHVDVCTPTAQPLQQPTCAPAAVHMLNPRIVRRSFSLFQGGTKAQLLRSAAREGPETLTIQRVRFVKPRRLTAR